MLADEFASAQRIIEAVGHTGLAAEYWAAIATAVDAWTESQRLENALREAALSVGMSAEAWTAIRLGEPEYLTSVQHVQRVPRSTLPGVGCAGAQGHRASGALPPARGQGPG